MTGNSFFPSTLPQILLILNFFDNFEISKVEISNIFILKLDKLIWKQILKICLTFNYYNYICITNFLIFLLRCELGIENLSINSQKLLKFVYFVTTFGFFSARSKFGIDGISNLMCFFRKIN